MESFIRKVVQNGDLGVLTKKIIKKKYVAELGLSGLTADENAIFSSTLYQILDEQKEVKSCVSPGCKENENTVMHTSPTKTDARECGKSPKKMPKFREIPVISRNIIVTTKSEKSNIFREKVARDLSPSTKEIENDDYKEELGENTISNVAQDGTLEKTTTTRQSNRHDGENSNTHSDDQAEKRQTSNVHSETRFPNKRLSVEDVLKAVMDTSGNPDTDVSSDDEKNSSSDNELLIDEFVDNVEDGNSADEPLPSSSFEWVKGRIDCIGPNSEQDSSNLLTKELNKNDESDSESSSEFVHHSRGKRKRFCSNSGSEKKKRKSSAAGKTMSSDSDCEYLKSDKQKCGKKGRKKPAVASTKSESETCDSEIIANQNITLVSNSGSDISPTQRKGKKKLLNSGMSSDSGMDSPIEVTLNREKKWRKSDNLTSSDSNEVLSCLSHRLTQNKTPLKDVSDSDSGSDVHSKKDEHKKNNFGSSSEDCYVGAKRANQKRRKCRTEDKHPVKRRKVHVYENTARSDSDEQNRRESPSSSSESDLTPAAKQSKKRQHAQETSSLSGSDIEDVPMQNASKIAKNVKVKSQKRTRHGSSSSDTDDDHQSRHQKKVESKKTSELPPKTAGDHPYVSQLKKICRAIGIFVQTNREMKGCDSNNSKIQRLKEILQRAGMKGRPSMQKVAEVRLLKEAAELDTSKIISNSEGRSRRNVCSHFAHNGPRSEVSLQLPFTPPKKKLMHLADIIDSEGSDSDSSSKKKPMRLAETDSEGSDSDSSSKKKPMRLAKTDSEGSDSDSSSKKKPMRLAETDSEGSDSDSSSKKKPMRLAETDSEGSDSDSSSKKKPMRLAETDSEGSDRDSSSKKKPMRLAETDSEGSDSDSSSKKKPMRLAETDSEGSDSDSSSKKKPMRLAKTDSEGSEGDSSSK